MTCGVDIALHDTIGKALNVPVYQLLGGKFRDRIPFAYPIKPCSVAADVDANLARIDWIQDLGHPTIRYYFGADLALDEKFLSELRKRWGDKVEINALDASGRFDVKTAIEVIERFSMFKTQPVRVSSPEPVRGPDRKFRRRARGRERTHQRAPVRV